MKHNKQTGGLAGISAGETEICTVGKEGVGLTYRGYDIYDLADNATFEEVAFLLLYGKLPLKSELSSYIERLKSLRDIPEKLKLLLEKLPSNSHPMDVLRTGISFLGNLEPEGSFTNQHKAADRLLAILPSILLYWHRYHKDDIRIDVNTDDNTVAGHFLHLLHDKTPSNIHRKILITTLILYADS
jgi:2-methylcitrate synthase